jgi:ribonuclease VapC
LSVYVLDSFAMLALMRLEPGADQVTALLREAEQETTRVFMSLISLGEMAYIVGRRWGAARLRDFLAYVNAVPIEIAPVNQDRVLAAAHVKARHSISYADAFAVALAQELGATVVTGDPEFRSVEALVCVQWL